MFKLNYTQRSKNSLFLLQLVKYSEGDTFGKKKKKYRETQREPSEEDQIPVSLH